MLESSTIPPTCDQPKLAKFQGQSWERGCAPGRLSRALSYFRGEKMRLKRDQDCDPIVFPVDLPGSHESRIRLQVLGLQKLCFKPCLAHVFEVPSHKHTTINRSSPEWLWLQLRTCFETMHAVAASPRLTCGPGGSWLKGSQQSRFLHAHSWKGRFWPLDFGAWQEVRRRDMLSSTLSEFDFTCQTQYVD